MQYGIAFTPLVPSLVLWLAVAAIAVVAALLLLGRARGGDGVSPIIITSNDLAGAWAIRPDGQPMLPLTPGEPRQREFAFRAGVNIVMYTLTGNYKADQVHAPALIERLGQ